MSAMKVMPVMPVMLLLPIFGASDGWRLRTWQWTPGVAFLVDERWQCAGLWFTVGADSYVGDVGRH